MAVKDGRRKNSGKVKDKKDKVVPVTIYKTLEQVELLGGIDNARQLMREKFDAAVGYVRQNK